MKQKMMFLTLTFMVLSAASVKSQVTIGSENEPHAGAVLDLQSTTQGFKLPCVALNNDLTQFVLPENETSTKTNATGMLVFNTNTNIGTGVYVWSGIKWIRVDNDYGTFGANLVVGSNTYITYVYPGTIGTWMISHSKEGKPDVTTYSGKTSGERGYYYRKANYASACPSGWHLPSSAEWSARVEYLVGRATPQEFMSVNNKDAYAGTINSAGSNVWWDTRTLYATSNYPDFCDMHVGRFNMSELNGDFACTVVCVKNP